MSQNIESHVTPVQNFATKIILKIIIVQSKRTTTVAKTEGSIVRTVGDQDEYDKNNDKSDKN